MKLEFLAGALLLVLFSCSGESENEIPDEEANFDSEIYLVTDAYPALEVEAIPIMERLEICTTVDTILHLPPCSNEFFRIYDYRPAKDWKTGFIVEMIPGLYNSPVHQIVIIEDYFGKIEFSDKEYQSSNPIIEKEDGNYSDIHPEQLRAHLKEFDQKYERNRFLANWLIYWVSIDKAEATKLLFFILISVTPCVLRPEILT